MTVFVPARRLSVLLLWAVISVVSAVYSQCPQGDLNRDCQVDLSDFVLLAQQWMEADGPANLDGLGAVELPDLMLMSDNWLVKDNYVVISEFLASNGNIILDEDGDSSDWIEFFNPMSVPVSMEGWYLTNDSDDLDKWRFPRINIDPGGYLIVYASGKDRRHPQRPLHTNFNLNANGDYLALVKPDAKSVVFSFDPEFPPQFRDVSYGISQITNLARLVSRKSPGKLLVPETQAQLDDNWNETDFQDASWWDITLGIGFDTSLGGSQDVEQVATSKTAQQSSTGFDYGPERAVDGDYDTFTHTLNSDENATWQVDLDGVYFISKIVLYNRLNCCQSRLRDITITIRDPDDTLDTFVSDLINPENVMLSPGYITIDLIELNGSAVYGGIVKVSRTPDHDLSGSDGLGNDDEKTVLSLAEVEVFASQTPNAYSEIFETNVFDQMIDKNASAYVRIPFQLSQVNNYSDLSLSIRYDDGFVAYLNGTEVARRNAPDSIEWNSSAATERTKDLTITAETVNLTNYFHLLQEGDNVLAFQALNYNAQDEDFLLDVQLNANDNILGAMCYMKDTSPGKLNNQGLPGVVADTKFSHDRGFYDQPFDVEITTETPGATLVYTTNASEPTLNNGTKIHPADAQTPPTGSIRISTTTTLRTKAFKDDYQPTNTDTQTYIFLDDVISSSVMNTAITQNTQYKPQMKNALTALPTMSIVTQPGKLEPYIQGPYPAWAYEEVPVSVEWILPDGAKGFQEDAGAARFGGHWYDRAGGHPFDKWSFRLYFRSTYGATKLKFPLFEGFGHGISPVETFDQLDLRSGSHDMSQRGFYMSSPLTADTMLEMGNVNPHSRFVHLYINGTYWGQYDLHERWNADMNARYLGGDKKDYESIKTRINIGGWNDMGEPYDGDGSVWQHTLSLRNDYEAVKPHLDTHSYIDFMLMWMFGESEEEFRCVGPMETGSGFKFWLNDADGFTRNVSYDITQFNSSSVNNSSYGPGWIFYHLFVDSHPDFRMLLADRIHKHFFNNGGLTQAAMTAKLLARCNEIELSFLGEAARWGYRSPTSWANARDNYINNILSTRPQILLGQLKNASFYPSLSAPVFKVDGSYQHGGYASKNASLAMRLSDDISYIDVELVGEDAPVRIHVPTDNSLGETWTQRTYGPDSTWTAGLTTTGVGYERTSGYANWIGTDVESQMYGKSTSVFCRIEFEYDASQALDQLQLRMKYDDGFVAYINGAEIRRSTNVTSDTPGNTSISSGHEAGASYDTFDDIDRSLLVNGTNVLAVHGINIGLTSSDMLVLPMLVGRIENSDPTSSPIWYTTDGSDPRLAGGSRNPYAHQYSAAITLNKSMNVKARTRDNGQWSALNETVFAVGPVAENVRITEIMYHPADPNTEFIELQNIGAEAVNLSLVKFANGIDFTFPSVTAQPGQYVLVVENHSEFAKRYDTAGMTIAGEFTGNLANNGEKIELLDAIGTTILEFSYKDGWYDITDGDGFSLTVSDASNTDVLLWGDKDTWKASTRTGGSPGVADTGPSPNDVVINEVLAHSDADVYDWIELRNRTDSEINIGGWFISDTGDDEPNLMKYRIVEGTTIAANGFIVFNESDHFGHNSTDQGSLIGFAFSENGERVYLTSAQGDVLTGLRISRSFGASLADVAFGEYIKSTGGTDFVAMSENTPWEVNKYPLVGPVIISEIMYHPADVKDAEYVELLNISDETVSLYDSELGAGWRFEELDGDNRIVFSFTSSYSMAPGERILLVKNRTAFESKFGTAVVELFEWRDGNLGNGDNRIQLSLPGDVDGDDVRQYIRIDRVNYSDGEHPQQEDELDPWPRDADGFVDDITGKCYSLTRKNDFVYGNDVDSWKAVIRSPGSANPDDL